MRANALRTVLFLLFLTILTIAGPISAWADIYCFTDSEGVVHFTDVPNDERYRVFLRTRKTIERTSYAALSGDIKRYDPVIHAACRRFGVDTNLVRAIIKAESNFNYLALSPKGARGLMQLMPQTAQEMSVFDIFDPAENIYGGVKYLKRLLGMFDGNIPLALAAYNAGPDRVGNRRQIPMIKETQDYVQRVLLYFRNYKNRYGYQENKML
ncbi:MAG: transglycosylase SLT domain-containing protein [Thermodesulfobacteriota bacterium]|nr:transglycosylase SLT domain-containing protein [Thermodesulfobacteriota bacterium]